MLNNGLWMPAFGIGTYSLNNETCFNSVYTALKNGYRLIDTAYMYGNEDEVGRGHQSELLKDPVLERIAEAHGKSVVQVILRWHYQRRVVAIPGSSNPAHIAENIDIFDFILTDQEMADIAALNRDEKHDWY